MTCAMRAIAKRMLEDPEYVAFKRVPLDMRGEYVDAKLASLVWKTEEGKAALAEDLFLACTCEPGQDYDTICMGVEHPAHTFLDCLSCLEKKKYGDKRRAAFGLTYKSARPRGIAKKKAVCGTPFGSVGWTLSFCEKPKGHLGLCE